MRYRTAGRSDGRWCNMVRRLRKGSAKKSGELEDGVTTRLIRIVVLAFAALLGAAAQAQAPFPSRPIRVLVTIPPGGAPDISARLIAHTLQETLGWSVVIEKPGASRQ